MSAGRVIQRLFLLLIALSLVLPLTARRGIADNRPVESFLAKPGFSEGWVMKGKVNRYSAENLYVYINGEAELFMPYGFEELASAFYTRGVDTGPGIVADIYRMRSLIDAFGIYSNYRDAGVSAVKAGAEGFIDDAQLMFYKGQYFVRLSVSGTVTGARDALAKCAQAIDRNLPDKPSAPGEIDMLHVPGVAPDTIRYIAQSILGYVFFKKGLIADIVIDGETAKAFVVIGESQEAAQAAFDQYIDYLKRAGMRVEPERTENGNTLKIQDPLYRGTFIRRSGRYVFGVTKLKDPQKAAPSIDGIQSRIGIP